MRENKTHIYVDIQERTSLLHSFVKLKNQLIQQGKKVLLIDTDAQFKLNYLSRLPQTRHMDLPFTLSTIMNDIIDDKSVYVSIIILHQVEGIGLLSSNIWAVGFGSQAD